MSKNCKARTQGGKSCQAKPLRGKAYCFTHDPQNARARAAARKLGGYRSRIDHGAATMPAQAATIADAQALLTYVLAELQPHENTLQRADKLIKLSLAIAKLYEISDIEKRLQALEEQTK